MKLSVWNSENVWTNYLTANAQWVENQSANSVAFGLLDQKYSGPMQ
jgi:hypothetical protein